MSPLKALFGFKGRMRRRDFWTYVAVFWAAYVALIAAGAAALHAVSPFTPGRSAGICILASLPLVVWIYLALHIKRLHDINRPASTVISTLRPILGWICGVSECGLRDGTPGPNAYGPSPKGAKSVADVFD